MTLDDRTAAAYLHRLGLPVTVPRSCAATLALVQERHLRTVPFENLDVVAGHRLDYSLDALVDKIVLRGRGGWCLETNPLLGHLLTHLGFTVDVVGAGVAARGGFKHDLSHLLLRVRAPDERYLVDVGFGHGGFVHPLPARPGIWTQPTGVHRVTEYAGYLVVERLSGGRAEPLYRVHPQVRQTADFAATTDFHELSPESPFHSVPHCARLTRDGWAVVSGDRLTLRNDASGGDPIRTRTLGDADHRAAVLAWVVGGAPRPPLGPAAPSGTTTTSEHAQGEPCTPSTT